MHSQIRESQKNVENADFFKIYSTKVVEYREGVGPLQVDPSKNANAKRKNANAKTQKQMQTCKSKNVNVETRSFKLETQMQMQICKCKNVNA